MTDFSLTDAKANFKLTIRKFTQTHKPISPGGPETCDAFLVCFIVNFYFTLCFALH